MNLKKLTIKELQALINTTKDLKVLEAAEDEYVNRVCQRYDKSNDEDYDDL